MGFLDADNFGMEKDDHYLGPDLAHPSNHFFSNERKSLVQIINIQLHSSQHDFYCFLVTGKIPVRRNTSSHIRTPLLFFPLSLAFDLFTKDLHLIVIRYGVHGIFQFIVYFGYMPKDQTLVSQL